MSSIVLPELASTAALATPAAEGANLASELTTVSTPLEGATLTVFAIAE
jgi:hypothetical protein